MNSNKKIITYSILLAILSVTFLFQASFIRFIMEAQSIKDNSVNRVGDIFATASASNRITFIFMLCNYGSFILSILLAFFSNVLSGRKVFSKWYWLSLAGILFLMIISYRLYFFDTLSFIPGILLPLSVWAQTAVNIIFHGSLFMFLYQKLWSLSKAKSISEAP